MKRYLRGFYMSFGMFCAVPLPFQLWDDSCANLMLPCFPLVGAVIGALWWGAAELLILSGIHLMFVSAVTALVPFLASGFLHLDGYMDTSDAVLSRRPPEEKLRILKDPHTGSFAVIMLAVLFIMQLASVYAIMEKRNYLLLFIAIPVISRCCSAISVLMLKTLPQSSYAKTFSKNSAAAHRIFIIVIAAAGIVFSFFVAGIYALIVAAAVIAGFWAAMAWEYVDLEGVSGDLAGFALVIGELAGLAAMAAI
ncbi:MAG: adenosylcobinamide-GDP ribazoletransferase [Treponema sp.]|nr:adenosylcobinamide-GDP ribazoletransferase [Treponema sp.]